jgi:leucyl/phenylalanyl-tRNA---protein transferase
MPIYRLSKSLGFPPPHLAEDGLLAVGGDLSSERLLLAYRHGIFPWYSEGEPILWWSPDPRMVLFPKEMHVSRRLRRLLNKECFELRFDTAFERVIEACATIPRPDQPGTWITPDMQTAYIRLHHEGYAHSVECWKDGELAGGMYGLSLGNCFFGESMFSRQTNASKVVLALFTERMVDWGFDMLDCQVENPHLFGLGARSIAREEFLHRLERSLKHPTRKGLWRE